MGFSEKQRLVLSTAWQQGHLLDSKNYGTISEVTGLSRKQVSNWARNQIHKIGSKPMPKKYSNDLLSIYYELPQRMRTVKDFLAFLAPRLAYELSAKRERIELTKTKARFTAQQRKVLTTAWERGFLCDHKNYANLSQITGLSRKQISNWARTKIHKCQGNMPLKNSAPLSTIFTELSLSLEEQDSNGEEKAEQAEACEDKQWYRHVKRECVQAQKLSTLELHPMPPWPIPLATNPIKLQKSSPMVHLPPPPMFGPKLPLPIATFRGYGAPNFLAPQLNYDPRSFNFNRVSSSTMVPNSAMPLSELKNWILQYSLNGINEVDDKRVEALSVTVCIADDDIICYLLHHGWYPTAAKTGMRYVRIGSAGF